jgi:hypothetical protein
VQAQGEENNTGSALQNTADTERVQALPLIFLAVHASIVRAVDVRVAGPSVQVYTRLSRVQLLEVQWSQGLCTLAGCGVDEGRCAAAAGCL